MLQEGAALEQEERLTQLVDGLLQRGGGDRGDDEAAQPATVRAELPLGLRDPGVEDACGVRLLALWDEGRPAQRPG